MHTSPEFTRREFLKIGARWTASAGILGRGALSLAAEPKNRWTVAIRDPHLRTTGQPDCWSALKQLGVSAVEVEVNPEMVCSSLYHPQKKYSLATPDDIKALQDDLAANGATITAFCMHNRLDDRLDRELEWTQRLLKAAGPLNVRTIRIDVVPQKTAADKFLPVAVTACKKLCELADNTSARYGIENHGRVTNDPEFLEKLFDAVGSPRLGLTLDALNFYWFGYPLDSIYGIIEKFAPRVFHTHCKSARYPADQRNVRRPIGWEYDKHAAPIYEGDINYPRVAALLRKANYSGDLCLENECLNKFPADKRADVLRQELTMLKGLA